MAADSQITTGGDIDYRDPIECEYSLTECRHPVCDCPRKESHTTPYTRNDDGSITVDMKAPA